MQNCKRLNRSGLVRANRPGTAYDVSVREFENKEVLSSTISLVDCQFRAQYPNKTSVLSNGVNLTEALDQLNYQQNYLTEF